MKIIKNLTLVLFLTAGFMLAGCDEKKEVKAEETVNKTVAVQETTVSEKKFVYAIENDEELGEFIKNEAHLVVDFYADWCPPCKILSPNLEKAAETYKDNIKVVKVNTDNFQNLARTYGIKSIPTVIYFKNGEEFKKEIGSRSYEQLVDIFNSLIE